MFFGPKSRECQSGDDITGTQLDGISLQVTVSSYRTRGFSTLLLDFLQATGGFSRHSPLSAYTYTLSVLQICFPTLKLRLIVQNQENVKAVTILPHLTVYPYKLQYLAIQ
jgi:hypothetical protein